MAGELFHRKALFDNSLPLAEYSSLEVSLWESGLVGGYGAVFSAVAMVWQRTSGWSSTSNPDMPDASLVSK